MLPLLPTSFLRGAVGGNVPSYPIFHTFNAIQQRYLSQPKTRIMSSILMGSPDGMASIDPHHPHHKHLITKLKHPSLELGVVSKQDLQEELKEQAKRIDEKLDKILTVTEELRVHAQEVLMQLSLNSKGSGDLRGKNVKSSS